MEFLMDPSIWAGLLTLVVLEIVLGIDNLVFIAILADKLPPKQRDKARLLGLSLALIMRLGLLSLISWMVTLTKPLFTVMDFSFSGLKTAALNIINSANQKGTPLNRADLAASYTEAVVHGIVKKTGMALTRLSGEVNTLVMAGGVAANSHLRTALDTLCRRRGIRFVVPERGPCGDNGAMIAAAGYFRYEKGWFAGTDLNASACDSDD